MGTINGLLCNGGNRGGVNVICFVWPIDGLVHTMAFVGVAIAMAESEIETKI